MREIKVRMTWCGAGATPLPAVPVRRASREARDYSQLKRCCLACLPCGARTHTESHRASQRPQRRSARTNTRQDPPDEQGTLLKCGVPSAIALLPNIVRAWACAKITAALSAPCTISTLKPLLWMAPCTQRCSVLRRLISRTYVWHNIPFLVLPPTRRFTCCLHVRSTLRANAPRVRTVLRPRGSL